MRGLLPLLLIAFVSAPLRGATPDPFARSVLESLASTERKTPEDLFDAVVKSAQVEAYDAAIDYLRRFDAALGEVGERRPDILADLGDTHDDGTLLALVRKLSPTEPAVAKVVRDIQTASRLRRRDPARLAAAMADLGSSSYARRSEAATRLSAARLDAVGTLVAWLDDPRHARGDDPATIRTRGIVGGLLRDLGEDGVVALLGWLGSPDGPDHPGIVSAIDLAGPRPDRVRRFLLAPSLVGDAESEMRSRARASLERTAAVPTKDAAMAELERCLDGVLCGDAGPSGDGGPGHAKVTWVPDEHADTPFWDAGKSIAGRASLSPRQRRSLEASHLARDLAALGGLDRDSRRLLLLARLESTLLVVDRNDPKAGQRIVAAVSNADGPSPAMIAEVLDEALRRGMAEAAEAAATVIAEIGGSPRRVLEPAVRRSLVRALDAPHLAVRFAAARALVVAGPHGLFSGQGRAVETLLDCAGSTGKIRVVVAHPNLAVRQELAASVASLGYAPTTAVRGRDAVVEARGSCDVRLVVLADDLGPPGAHETAQFLSWIATDGPLEVVIVRDSFDLSDVAPVDDETRAKAAERLARAGESLRLLALLARDGEDVNAAMPVAVSAVNEPSLAPSAIDLLSLLGRPQAQETLHAIIARPDASDDLKERAISALRTSVGRFGILLKNCDLSEEYRRYNDSADQAGRRWSGLVLDILESPSSGDPETAARLPSGDAPKSR